MKKMTKRDYFTILRDSYPTTAENYDAVVAFIDHELELLEKKNSADKKPTATQQANALLKAAILDYMEANRLYTISEMLKDLSGREDLAEQKLSSQRLTAVVGQMCSGMTPTVERVEEKRRAYFRKLAV